MHLSSLELGFRLSLKDGLQAKTFLFASLLLLNGLLA